MGILMFPINTFLGNKQLVQHLCDFLSLPQLKLMLENAYYSKITPASLLTGPSLSNIAITIIWSRHITDDSHLTNFAQLRKGFTKKVAVLFKLPKHLACIVLFGHGTKWPKNGQYS